MTVFIRVILHRNTGSGDYDIRGDLNIYSMMNV